jgi:hypothetical protein
LIDRYCHARVSLFLSLHHGSIIHGLELDATIICCQAWYTLV